MKSIPLKIFLIVLAGVFLFFSPLKGQEGELGKLRETLKKLMEQLREAEKKRDQKEILRLKEEAEKAQKALSRYFSQGGLRNTLERLKRLYKLYQYFGQKEEAGKVQGILQKLSRMIPGTSKETRQMIELQKKIYFLLKKAQEARKKGQHQLATRLLQELEDVEKAFQSFQKNGRREEAIKELTEKHQRLILEARAARGEGKKEALDLLKQAAEVEKEIQRIEKENREYQRREQIRSILTKKIQQFTDEAVGARMRGDEKRVQELAREIGRLKSRLSTMAREDHPLLKLFQEIRYVIEGLQEDGLSNSSGDRKRYFQIKNEIEKLSLQSIPPQKTAPPAPSGVIKELLHRLEEARKKGSFQEFGELLEKIERLMPSLPQSKIAKNTSPSRFRKLEERVEKLERELRELKKKVGN